MLPRSLQNKEAMRVALADWRLWAVLVFIGAAGLLLTVYASGSETSGSPIVINGTAVPPAPVLKPESVRRGQMIYTRFCANCHGQNLEGAPDWKTPLASGSFPAPPQDSSGHTWHRADLVRVEIIVKGGVSENSPMPAFAQPQRRSTMVTDGIEVSVWSTSSSAGDEPRYGRLSSRERKECAAQRPGHFPPPRLQ